MVSKMDIRSLQYFNQVADSGNITRAARQLHVSQPALSRQIKEMETELGVQLLIRGHNRVQLTQAGQYLYNRGNEIIGLMNHTIQNVSEQDEINGVLEIGAGESIALLPVMTVINQIIDQYPDTSVNIVSGDEQLIKQKLDNGALDFGIIMGNDNLIDYQSLAIPDDNIWGVLVTKDDPLAKLRVITIKDLINRKILISDQAYHQDKLRQWAGNNLNKLTFSGRFNLINNAKLLVETGNCVALTYKGLVESSKTVFRPLSPILKDHNYLIWNNNHQLSNVGKLFVKKLKNQFQTNINGKF